MEGLDLSPTLAAGPLIALAGMVLLWALRKPSKDQTSAMTTFNTLTAALHSALESERAAHLLTQQRVETIREAVDRANERHAECEARCARLEARLDAMDRRPGK